jgi:hypothetical protein
MFLDVFTLYYSRVSFEQLYDAQFVSTFVTRLYQRGRVKVTCSQTNTHNYSDSKVIPLLLQSYTQKIASHPIIHHPPNDRHKAQHAMRPTR